MPTHVSKLVVLMLTISILSIPAFPAVPNVVAPIKHGPSVPPDPWDGARVTAASMLDIQSPEALPIDNNLLASLPEMSHMLTALAVAKANRNSPINTPVTTANLTDCDPNTENCDDGHGPSVPPCPSDGVVSDCELVCIYWFYCFTVCDSSCTQ